MKQKIKRNYYTVEVPSDCESNPEKRFDLAILEARERASLYVIPCQWRKIWDDGENIRIVRER